jgi:hypothetical protein
MSTSTNLDFRKMYRLDDPLASRPLRLSIGGYSDWLTGEQAWALFRGEFKMMEPLKLKADRGGQATDFLWSTFPPLVCISIRIANLFRTHDVTGWTTYPVEVFGRKGEALSGYLGFAVKGQGGSRDRSRSQIITKPAPTSKGQPRQVYRGLYFNKDQWDGSDVFWVQGIVVTDKVRMILKTAKATNVALTPLPDVEIDVYLDKLERA